MSASFDTQYYPMRPEGRQPTPVSLPSLEFENDYVICRWCTIHKFLTLVCDAHTKFPKISVKRQNLHKFCYHSYTSFRVLTFWFIFDADLTHAISAAWLSDIFM